MDFWLGRWEVTFAGAGGETITGRNTVSRNRGRVFELFVASDEGNQYVGASITRHERARGLWIQEYWDSQEYRAWYQGGWEGDRFILVVTERGGQQGGTKRLVWRHITAHALTWDNQQTSDGGRTWTSTWTIEYRRLPDDAGQE